MSIATSPGGSCAGNVWFCGRCMFSERCHDEKRVTRESLRDAPADNPTTEEDR